MLHQRERLARLDLAIDRAIESAPAQKKVVIDALQALRGVAKLATAVAREFVGFIWAIGRLAENQAASASAQDNVTTR